MSKVNVVKRVYLTIEIEEPWLTRKPNDWTKRGYDLVSRVAKLISASEISYLDSVDWRVESRDECSLCHLEYEVGDNGPLCCDEAQAEWQAQLLKEVRNVQRIR